MLLAWAGSGRMEACPTEVVQEKKISGIQNLERMKPRESATELALGDQRNGIRHEVTEQGREMRIIS